MAISYGTYTITEVQEGSQIWTSSVAPSSPNYTFTISNLTGDSETSVKAGDIIMYSYYRYTVLSVSADGTTVLAGNRVSIRGETGASAVTYSLIVSNLAIVKDKNGDISPASIILTAKSQTGSGAMANYAGRFKIETTTDNSTWTTQYTSSANESTKNWNVVGDIIAIRCSLYLKDGTTTLLDQQTIPIISDGADGTNGTNGADAYTVILTNENHTFTGNTTSAIASEIECNVIAYKGATQIASTIGTITGQPTGMTTSLLNNGTVNSAFKVTVTTSMVTRNGVLNVPITVDGKTFTKEFTYALTLDGEKGDKGDTAQWYYGDSLTHTSGTSTLPISQTTGVTVGAMYLNTKTGTCYKCTAISGSNATWTYAGNITDGIEIGGRNLLKGSDISHTSLSGYTVGGTVTRTIPSGTTITLSVQIDADDVVWGSSGNRRMGVASSITKDSGGTQYIEAWAAMTGYTSTGVDKTFDTSFHGRVKSTYVLQGELPLDKVFNLYIQNVTSGTVSVSKPKLEIGNKGTDWTPAPEDIEADIDDAKKVATNYLSIDNTGIMVADMTDGEQTPSGISSGNNVFINNTSVNIREGQSTLASFGVDGMQIGLDNETRTEQDYHSWKMVDKDDNVYAFVSDLRDENGEATVTEVAELTLGTNWGFAETNFEINSVISITVNGEVPDTYEIVPPVQIKFQPIPPEDAVVVVTYTSQSSQLKAYTFGKRIQNSNIGGYSFVEGVNNVASGYTSHAEGNSNTSSGEASHVEGILNTAQGRASHAQNFCTTASSDYQTTIGKYNVDDPNNQYAFIVGNGGLNRIIHETDYSNALAIGWNGDMQIGRRMFGTLVENPDPAHELPTRTSIPLFKTVSWTGNSSDDWNNVTIAKNSVWSRTGFNIYQKGYSALGVVGFGVYPALTNPANTNWCIITRCYTWYNSNLIMEDGHVGGETLDVCVWNQHPSQSAKVRIFVRVLYIAESAFTGV